MAGDVGDVVAPDPRDGRALTTAERLAAAIYAAQGHRTDPREGPAWDDRAEHLARAILLADPAIRAALALGLAWQEATEAMPSGVSLHFETDPDDDPPHVASAVRPGIGYADDDWLASGAGMTPEAALRALAAALRERQP